MRVSGKLQKVATKPFVYCDISRWVPHWVESTTDQTEEECTTLVAKEVAKVRLFSACHPSSVGLPSVLQVVFG